MTSPPEGTLRLERDGATAVLTLCDPATRNALTGEPMLKAMLEALGAVAREPAVAVLVVTGEGPAFSSGADVRDLAAQKGMFGGTAAEIERAYRTGIQQVPRQLVALEIPTIAAVNGPAYGAGCDLALACDMRIASTRATFAQNFVRLGLVSGDGGAWLLPRIVGMARAAEAAFTGDPIDAATAAAWGLVNGVCEPEALLAAALALAARIARNPSGAVRMTKTLLRHSGAGASFDDALDRAAAFQAFAHGTDEHVRIARTLRRDA